MNSKSQRGRTDSRHDDQADDRDDDFTDNLLARRRAKRSAASQRNAIVIAGVAGLLAIAGSVGLVAYLLKKPAGQGNVIAGPGETAKVSKSEPGPSSSASSALKAVSPAAGVPAAVGIGVPSAAKEGETWTHRELFEHLKAKGVVVEMVPIRPGGFWGGPMVELKTASGVAVTIIKEPTAGDAKDSAALDEKRFCSWGRFCFVSEDPNLIASVRTAMK